MLRTIILAVLFLSANVINAQNGFLIVGKLNPSNSGKKVLLNYSDGTQTFRDSTVVENGAFQFKGAVAEPVKARISFPPPGGRNGDMQMPVLGTPDGAQDFYLENTVIKVDGADLNSATITGGSSQADYMTLQAMLKPVQDQMKMVASKMMKLFNENKQEEAMKFAPEQAVSREKLGKMEDEFILKYPNTYVTLELLYERGVVDEKAFGLFYNPLPRRLKETARGKVISERIAAARKIGIGTAAPAFAMNNQEGVPVSLASLKGKYVLVDFWASWCGPCRAENPHVVKAYNRFKEKNFEILAVSLDADRSAWLKAIKDDGLPWLHVSDLKGWDTHVVKDYDIKGVPANFLVGPDGKILAKGLRGDALQAKLAEILL